MKTLKKFLPLLTIGAVGLTVAPFAASCSCSNSPVESIELEFGDNFTEDYYAGDKVSLDGVTIYANFKDGKRSEVKAADCVITPSLKTSLTKNDTEVVVNYKGATASFPIYVYESIIDIHTDEIERFEPVEPEKVYTKEEVATVYFDESSNEQSYPHIVDDVKGHISDYAKIAGLALIAEQRTFELLPIVQQAITFLINFFLEDVNINFIGQFNDCEINVQNIEVNYNKVTKVAKLSGDVTVGVDTQMVDRTDITKPEFLPSLTNWFEAGATIHLQNVPYVLTYWQMAEQEKPYWGLAIKQDYLETESDWAVSIDFKAKATSTWWSGRKQWEKFHYYSKSSPFPSSIKSQLIDFMQFQSYYLDKLKGTNN